jgi:hypothetical protein
MTMSKHFNNGGLTMSKKYPFLISAWREEYLAHLAADMFISETRRGWIANGCSWLGSGVDSNMTEQQYVELFVERHKHLSLDEIEEMANDARPSNMPTAYERGE